MTGYQPTPGCASARTAYGRNSRTAPSPNFGRSQNSRATAVRAGEQNHRPIGQCSEPLSRCQPVDAQGATTSARWYSRPTSRPGGTPPQLGKLEGRGERGAKGIAGLLDDLQEMARGIARAIVAPGTASSRR